MHITIVSICLEIIVTILAGFCFIGCYYFIFNRNWEFELGFDVNDSIIGAFLSQYGNMITFVSYNLSDAKNKILHLWWGIIFHSSILEEMETLFSSEGNCVVYRS